MRRNSLLAMILVGAMLATVGAAGGAHAAQPTEERTHMVCVFAVDKWVRPGLTSNPVPVRFAYGTDNYQPADCVGTIKGRQITGNTEFFDLSRLVYGSCAQGAGFTFFSVRAATASGTRVFNGTYTFGHIDGVGSFGGDADGQFQFGPAPGGGDCTPAAPTTKIIVKHSMTIDA